MLITVASLDALRTEFSLVFGTAYKQTEVWCDQLATAVPSSSRSNTYGWLAQQLVFREWVGARVAQNLSEHAQIVVNKPWEGTCEVSKFDIEDDNLGVYKAQILPQLANAAAKHPDELLAALILSNPFAFDGKRLFADDHPTYDEAGSTYDNDYALALDPDNFNTVWSAMASLKGENGKPLQVLPNRLVVPPQLRKKAEEITKASSVLQRLQNVAASENVAAAAVDNVMKGWAEPLILPELSSEPTQWYLACTSKPIKPFIHQVRTPVSFTARFNPEDPAVFDRATFVFGGERRGNVAPTLPFLIARSKP